jgi:hypothetical protein
MKKILLSLLIAICWNTYSQAPSIEWGKTFGGSSADVAFRVIPTSDGGYVVGAHTLSNNGDVTGNHGSRDIWIFKINSTGTIQWQKTLGGSALEYIQSLIQTTDGGYAAAGNTFSNDGDVTGQHGTGATSDAWLVKLSADGDIEWQKTYGGTGSESFRGLSQTADGGYICAGEAASTDGDVTGYHGGPGLSDCWVVKVDAVGTLEWQKCLGGTDTDFAYAAIQTPDGNFIVAGNPISQDGDITNSHGGSDFWIVKLSDDSSILWQKSMGGSSGENLYSMIALSDGNFIACGQSGSMDGDVTGNHGNWDVWIVKFDTDGTIIWQKSYGGTAAERATSIKETADGHLVFGGQTNSNNGDVSSSHGAGDAWLVQTNLSGDMDWEKTYGGSTNEEITNIVLLADGSFIFSGYTDSVNGDILLNHGGLDAWIVKLSGDLNTISFDTKEVVLFPNPATTTLHLNAEQVIDKVIVVDYTGRVILVKSVNTSDIDVANFANGAYILEAYSNGRVVRTKFIKN